MYYEESKKNLMSLLRQNGCPSIFLTLSCAEFDWPELLKEICETVYRRKVSNEEIESLSKAEKNKLLSENVVQTSLHFHKRIEKMFLLMKDDFFDGPNKKYHVNSYFYRVEFQQRGSPHIHSLLWLKDEDGQEAPNFWIQNNKEEQTEDQNTNNIDNLNEDKKIELVEAFADSLISTSPEDISCIEHQQGPNKECGECTELKEKVEKYQSHNHTFTCEKKKQTVTIKEEEGHGRWDGYKKGAELKNIPLCRFNFPKFPLDETKLVKGISKDESEDVIKQRRGDLNKIKKYLIRQTYES